MTVSKTVVTGGAGFIGSHLVKSLLTQGRKVIVASDFSLHGMDNLITIGVNPSDIEVRDADLTEYKQSIKAVKGAETVFHLAARVGSLKYLHSSDTAELSALQQNLLIDTNVFRACQITGVKNLIYASSCAVYPMHRQYSEEAVFAEADLDLGNPDYLYFNEPKAEKTELIAHITPDGGYGWSKLMGEIQLSWMKDIRIGIARIFNVYGVNEPIGENAHVVADLIKKVILYPEEEFVVWGNGHQTRDFLYVTDCSQALISLEAAISNLGIDSPLIVNVGSDSAVPIGILAKQIITISGKTIQIRYDITKPVGPRGRTGNIEKAKRCIGWKPKRELHEGLVYTYRWIEKRMSAEKSGKPRDFSGSNEKIR